MTTRAVTVGLLALACAPVAFAADQTWTGTISDSKCGLTHQAMIEHNKGMTERACTEACVKSGAKFVLASGGKVYLFENQNDPAIAANAGQTVVVTGEVHGDTITAAKIASAVAKR